VALTERKTAIIYCYRDSFLIKLTTL